MATGKNGAKDGKTGGSPSRLIDARIGLAGLADTGLPYL